MPTNIALFLDGTWNQARREPCVKDTNVLRLFRLAGESPRQKLFYRVGVGTDSWFGIPRMVRNIFAGAVGLGISAQIKEAYGFLCRVYRPGDNVYLFGFSRGAFAARSLAGFANAVGLLLAKYADDPSAVELAYSFYENQTKPKDSGLRNYLRKMTDAEQPSADGRTLLPIYLIGVWDTVGTVGLPNRSFFSAPFTEFHQTELPGNVTNARHALALHELRGDFKPVLWERMSPENSAQSLEQVWFPGVHSDVGGGYSEQFWSDAAFIWMAEEAQRLGLELREALPALPFEMEEIHQSLKFPFNFRPSGVRDALSQRHMLDSETTRTFGIHQTVRDRLASPRLRQYNFKRNVNIALKAVDEASLQLSIEAAFDSVGRSFPNQEWWAASRLCNLENSAETLQEFLNDGPVPFAAETEVFVRAMCLQSLLGNQTSLTSFLSEFQALAKRKLDIASRDPNETRDATNLWAQHLGRIAKGMDEAVSRVPNKYRPNIASVAEKLGSSWQHFIGTWHAMQLRHFFGDRFIRDNPGGPISPTANDQAKPSEP